MAEGIQVGSAYVSLGTDDAPLQRGLNAAEGGVRSWAGKLSGIFTTAGAGLSAGVTAPLLLLGNKAIAQASDLNENMNKVQVTFDDAAQGIVAFGDTAAENLGLAKSEALAAAGTFGNMFDAMGMSDQAAADMSKTVLQLGADLGSFHNVDPSDMLEKLRSELVGEVEPLRSVGILLSEAAVKAKAMAMGFGDAKGNLTESEKVQARLALIMEQSKNATGDFARTSEGLANATRIQNAMWQDTIALIGQQLLPIKLQLVQVVQQVLGWFQHLSPQTQQLAVTLAAVAAAAGPVLLVLGALAGAVAAIGAPVLLAVAAVGALGVAFATNFGGIRDTVSQVGAAFEPVIGAAERAIAVFTSLQSSGLSTFDSLAGALQGFLSNFMSVDQAVGVVDTLRSAWETLGETWQKVSDFFAPTIERLKSGFGEMLTGLEPVSAKLGELVGAFENLWTAVEPIVAKLAEVVGTVLVAAFNLLLEVAAAVMPDVGNIISGAIDIAVTVLNTLATVVTEVVAAVTDIINGDWTGAWEHAGTIIETLVTAAETILGKLIGIIATILGDVLAGVKQWLTNLDSEWKTKLDAVVGTVKAKFYQILGTIVMTLGDIKAAVTGFDLRSAGASLIDGMVEGIKSKAAALVEAARGVVSNAIQAVHNALDMHSPSGVFADIGQAMMEGLTLGLTESQQQAIDALSQVFQNVTSIAEAMAMISGYRANAGLTNNLSTMINQVKDVVHQLADLAGWLAEVPASGVSDYIAAKAGTDALRPIMDNVKAMTDTMSALASYKIVGNISDMVADMIAAYKEVVRQFADMAEWLVSAEGLGSKEKLAAAVGALGAIAVVADSFGAIFQAWSGVAKAGNLAGPKNMGAMLDSIIDMLKQVVTRLGGLKLDISDELIDFAGRAADVAKAFGDIAKAWETLGKFEAAKFDAGKVVDWLADLSGNMLKALERVQAWQNITPNDAFGSFVTAVKAAVGLIADAAKAWDTIRDFEPNNGKLNVDGAVEWLASLAGLATRAIERIQKWGGITPNDTFNAFVTSVKGAIGLIADAAKAWETIQDFVANQGKLDIEGVTLWLASLAGLATRAIERIQKWGGITPNEAFTTFTAAVKSALSTISDAAKTWETLQGFKANAGKLNVNDVVDWLASVAGIVTAAMVKVAKRPNIQASDEFQKIIANIKASLQALDETMKFLDALNVWQAAGDVQAKVQALTAQLRIIVDEIGISAVNMRALVTDSLIKFVNDVAALANGLTAVVSLLQTIDELKNTGDIPLAVSRIGEVIRAVLTGMQDIIYDIDEDASGLISAFSSAVGDLMGALKTALELALAIPDQWGTPDQSKWNSFETWVKGVFRSFYNWVNGSIQVNPDGTATGSPPQFDETGLSLVATFAGALNNLMTALKSALDLALAVPAKWETPNPAKWNAFTAWVKGVFMSFYDWVTGTIVVDPKAIHGGTAPRFDEKGLTLVNIFAGALNSLMSGLKTALDLALAVPAEWSTPDPAKWSAFDAWVKEVFTSFSNYVQANYGDEGGKGHLEMVALFGQALESLMNGLASAVQLAIAVPTTWSRPSVATWDKFDAWVKQVFISYAEYVQAHYGDATGTERLTLVKTFSEALSGVMGALRDALTTALALPADWTGVPTGPDSPYAKLKLFMDKVWSDMATYVAANLPANSEAAKNLPVVKAFADAANSVFQALGTALDVFKNLQGYIPLLNSRIDNFVGSVTYAYGLIQTYATGAGVTAGTAATKAFAETTSAVFSALKSALELFTALGDPAAARLLIPDATGDPLGTFKSSLDGLISRISTTLGAWKTYIQTEANAKWTPAAQGFKTAVDGVFSTLKTALDLFKDLNTAGMPSPTQISAFLTAVTNLFGQFVLSVEGVPADVDQAGKSTGTVLSKWPTLWAQYLDSYQTFGGSLAVAMTIGFQSALIAVNTPNNVMVRDKLTIAMNGMRDYLDWYHTSKFTALGGAEATALAAGFRAGTLTIAATINNPLTLGMDKVLEVLNASYTNFYNAGGAFASALAVGWQAAMTAQAQPGSFMLSSTYAVTDAIKAAIKKAFGIASPSTVMQGYGEMVAAGLGGGILAGLPGVEAAAASLYRAAQPALAVTGEWDVNNRKVITVRFEGQAGGGVPLSPQQFDSLKRDLAYAIAIGA